MTTVYRVAWRETTTTSITYGATGTRTTEHVEDHPTRLRASLRAAQVAKWEPMVYEFEVQP